MNPVRKLRKALGLAQDDFAQLTGRKYSSIRNYERGIPMPRDFTERLASLAVQKGFPDIAVELRAPFEVKRVLEPGETLISAARERGENTAAPSPPAPLILGGTDRDRFHALLDEVFDSADPDAVSAVTRNLDVFAQFVRLRRSRPKQKEKKERLA